MDHEPQEPEWSRLVAIGIGMQGLLQVLQADPTIASIYRREAKELLKAWRAAGGILAIDRAERPSPVILLATQGELTGEAAPPARPRPDFVAPSVEPRRGKPRKFTRPSPREMQDRIERVVLECNQHGPRTMPQLVASLPDLTRAQIEHVVRKGSFRSRNSWPPSWEATQVSALWTPEMDLEHGPPQCSPALKVG